MADTARLMERLKRNDDGVRDALGLHVIDTTRPLAATVAELEALARSE